MRSIHRSSVQEVPRHRTADGNWLHSLWHKEGPQVPRAFSATVWPVELAVFFPYRANVCVWRAKRKPVRQAPPGSPNRTHVSFFQTISGFPKVRSFPSVKKAFTLIELLIVVAIIAILAAIAVPNFLEAQMRAKVSRCNADMRTIATGLESYRVDNNSLPHRPRSRMDRLDRTKLRRQQIPRPACDLHSDRLHHFDTQRPLHPHQSHVA